MSPVDSPHKGQMCTTHSVHPGTDLQDPINEFKPQNPKKVEGTRVKKLINKQIWNGYGMHCGKYRARIILPTYTRQRRQAEGGVGFGGWWWWLCVCVRVGFGESQTSTSHFQFVETGNIYSSKSETRSFDILFDLPLNKSLSKLGDLGRHCAHYDVIVMLTKITLWYITAGSMPQLHNSPIAVNLQYQLVYTTKNHMLITQDKRIRWYVTVL